MDKFFRGGLLVLWGLTLFVCYRYFLKSPSASNTSRYEFKQVGGILGAWDAKTGTLYYVIGNYHFELHIVEGYRCSGQVLEAIRDYGDVPKDTKSNPSPSTIPSPPPGFVPYVPDEPIPNPFINTPTPIVSKQKIQPTK